MIPRLDICPAGKIGPKKYYGKAFRWRTGTGKHRPTKYIRYVSNATYKALEKTYGKKKLKQILEEYEEQKNTSAAGGTPAGESDRGGPYRAGGDQEAG